jgi:hypothetical protein
MSKQIDGFNRRTPPAIFSTRLAGPCFRMQVCHIPSELTISDVVICSHSAARDGRELIERLAPNPKDAFCPWLPTADPDGSDRCHAVTEHEVRRLTVRRGLPGSRGRAQRSCANAEDAADLKPPKLDYRRKPSAAADRTQSASSSSPAVSGARRLRPGQVGGAREIKSI